MSLPTPTAANRILSRKQIEKRLENLSIEECAKIANNLTQQNAKLKKEVQQLSEKVKGLVEKKGLEGQIVTDKGKNKQAEQQVLKAKKELELKYESMNHLKDQIKKQQMLLGVNDTIKKTKDRDSTLKDVEQQITNLETEKKSLTSGLHGFEDTLKDYNPDPELDAKIKEAKQENKKLKASILDQTTSLKEQQKNSQTVLSRIYDLKKNEQRAKELKKLNALEEGRSVLLGDQGVYGKDLPSKKELSSRQISLISNKAGQGAEFATLIAEVQELKKAKKNVERTIIQQRASLQQRRNKFEADTRHSLEMQKEIAKRRVKALNQLNHQERKEKQLKDKIQELKKPQPIKVTPSTSEKLCQTDTVVKAYLRKDWIGPGLGQSWDDSDLVLFKSQAYIRAAIVYKVGQTIVWIRFLYETRDPLSQRIIRIESRSPVPLAYLTKCNETRYGPSEKGGYLSSMTVSATRERVSQIQLHWSDGTNVGVTVASPQPPKEMIKYKLDLKAEKERPVSFFGTVAKAGKGTWVLEGIGCEILEADE